MSDIPEEDTSVEEVTKSAIPKLAPGSPRPHIPMPATPKSMTDSEKDVACMELRKAGWSFPQIGALLGMRGKDVERLVKRRLRQAGRIIFDSAKDIIALEDLRMNDMLRALWPKAMAGDVRSQETVIKIMERRANLLGLDAPKKTETKLDATYESYSYEELIVKAQELGVPVIPELPAGLSLPGLEDHSQPTKEVIEDATFTQLPAIPVPAAAVAELPTVPVVPQHVIAEVAEVPVHHPTPEVLSEPPVVQPPEPHHEVKFIPFCTLCKRSHAGFTCDCKLTFAKSSSVYLCESCRSSHQCGTVRALASCAS